MVASHGDNFPSGVHGDSFQAITAYFQQRSCRYCSESYRPEGIELVREEPGVVVVKVGCLSCGQPLGIALVAVNTPAQTPATAPSCMHGRPTAQVAGKRQPSDLSKRDMDRLGKKPPISYDDVLSAHQFFQSLGSDWAQHLPKPGAKRS